MKPTRPLADHSPGRARLCTARIGCFIQPEPHQAGPSRLGPSNRAGPDAGPGRLGLRLGLVEAEEADRHFRLASAVPLHPCSVIAPRPPALPCQQHYSPTLHHPSTQQPPGPAPTAPWPHWVLRPGVRDVDPGGGGGGGGNIGAGSERLLLPGCSM